ncbi:hypothetical protein IHE45_18G019600 [Dioscorea alata]|uniref:Uncharacterized protein n=1 Tax=Dioscorea alata TaxID=55571 RepID=A0ACB7U5N4_DIOAL|nr:hypothetical protein IHE45_18G019600 [Dioscorea alata]
MLTPHPNFLAIEIPHNVKFAKKWGHIAATCSYRYPESRNNSKNQNSTYYEMAFSALNHTCNTHTSVFNSNSLPEWLPDTGAASHMTPDPQLVEFISQYQGSTQVTVNNGNNLPISSIGKLTFSTYIRPLHLNDVLMLPHLTANLLSVAKYVKNNSCLIEFHPFSYIVKDFRTRIPLLTSNIHNNLYPMQIPSIFQNHVAFVARHTPLNCGINDLDTHAKPSCLIFLVLYLQNLM